MKKSVVWSWIRVVHKNILDSMNENVVMLIEKRSLQRSKPRSWNSVWQNQTCDALEHAWDLWTWCGSYRAGEGKGWAGELSSLGERKIDSNLGDKLPKEQSPRSKTETHSWSDEGMAFWALLLNESSKNFNCTSHQALKAISHFDVPFSPIFVVKWCQWVTFERP